MSDDKLAVGQINFGPPVGAGDGATYIVTSELYEAQITELRSQVATLTAAVAERDAALEWCAKNEAQFCLDEGEVAIVYASEFDVNGEVHWVSTRSYPIPLAAVQAGMAETE